jgi:hypothetical protein
LLTAGVSPQIGHLGKLSAAHLVVQMKLERHQHFRLAGREVGQMLEGISNVALRARISEAEAGLTKGAQGRNRIVQYVAESNCAVCN